MGQISFQNTTPEQSRNNTYYSTTRSTISLHLIINLHEYSWGFNTDFVLLWLSIDNSGTIDQRGG